MGNSEWWVIVCRVPCLAASYRGPADANGASFKFAGDKCLRESAFVTDCFWQLGPVLQCPRLGFQRAPQQPWFLQKALIPCSCPSGRCARAGRESSSCTMLHVACWLVAHS